MKINLLGRNGKIKLRKTSMVYMGVISMLIIILRIFNLKVFMVSMALEIFTSGVSVLVAKVQDKWKNYVLIRKNDTLCKYSCNFLGALYNQI